MPTAIQSTASVCTNWSFRYKVASMQVEWLDLLLTKMTCVQPTGIKSVTSSQARSFQSILRSYWYTCTPSISQATCATHHLQNNLTLKWKPCLERYDHETESLYTVYNHVSSHMLHRVSFSLSVFICVTLRRWYKITMTTSTITMPI